MHVLGILVLFLGAILPLSSLPLSSLPLGSLAQNSLAIPALGVPVTVATIAVLPVLIYWFLLDAALGTAIVGAAILLLSAAAIIVSHATVAAMWSITAVLIVIGITSQIVGHRVFEQRQPALVDNPAHLLLGPMFVMAKLFIALGFRNDLAAVIAQVPQTVAPNSSLYSGSGSHPRA
jgi:uncharacterized membrane protein YGL010W